jgi:DNA-binding NarL/FixJ family response regulator
MKQVLIVENSILISDRIAEMLRESKSASIVNQTGTYKETIQLMKQVKPDVVIIDSDLSDGSFLQHIKYFNQQFSKLLIIVLCSDKKAFFQQDLKKEGVAFVIDKYLEFERLPDCIK